MTLDLRLVPAALAAWGAAVLACAGTARVVAAAAVGLVLVTAVVLALLRVVTRPSRSVGPEAPTGWATAVVAVAAAVAVLLSCAAQLRARENGDLPDLVAERAAVTVVGTVASEPAVIAGGGYGGEERVRVVVVVEGVSGRGRSTQASAALVVLGDASWTRVPYGGAVRTSGRLAPVGPGERVVGLLAAGDPEVIRPPGAVDRTVGRLRDAVLDLTADLPPDERGLVPGAAIGDTSRVPADLEQAMRDTGLTHVTAVSGGHFAVVAMAVLTTTALLRAGRVVRALSLALGATGFVLLVHPEPSVLRAAAMAAVTVLGLLAGRRAAPVPALAGAVVVLCVLDPWLARSYGFVLSALATAAIVVLAPVLAGSTGTGPPGRAVLVVAVPAAAQAVCAPVLVLLDPAVGTYAVPANVLAAPAVLPATLFGVLATLLAPWAPEVAGVVAVPAAFAASWIAGVARTLAALPGARVPWPAGAGGALGLAVLTAVVLVLLVRAGRRGPRTRLVAWATCLALVAGTAVPGPRDLVRGWPPSHWSVVACDVGQGDALVVRSGPGSAVLVDTGPPDGGVGDCLRGLGVGHLDLLVLTHHHADHTGGLADVLDAVSVEHAVLSPLEPHGARTGATRTLLAEAGVTVTTGLAGLAGEAGAVRWEVVWPTRAPRSTYLEGEVTGSVLNDASVVLLLEVDGLDVVALGDVEPAAQDGLLAELERVGAGREVDVVKVAHHGSAHQSAALAAWLAPRVALVSAGADNTYGHPAPSAIALHESAGALVLSTHECGPVAVGAPAEELRVWAGCLR